MGGEGQRVQRRRYCRSQGSSIILATPGISSWRNDRSVVLHSHRLEFNLYPLTSSSSSAPHLSNWSGLLPKPPPFCGSSLSLSSTPPHCLSLGCHRVLPGPLQAPRMAPALPPCSLAQHADRGSSEVCTLLLGLNPQCLPHYPSVKPHLLGVGHKTLYDLVPACLPIPVLASTAGISDSAPRPE